MKAFPNHLSLNIIKVLEWMKLNVIQPVTAFSSQFKYFRLHSHLVTKAK